MTFPPEYPTSPGTGANQPVQPPMGYPPPGYGPTGNLPGFAPVGIAPVQATSGWASASFICGILGFCTIVTWPLAIIFGHIALAKINASQGRLRGTGLAITGLVMGYLAVAAGIIGLIVAAASSASH